jgi:hypothetical protein
MRPLQSQPIGLVCNCTKLQFVLVPNQKALKLSLRCRDIVAVVSLALRLLYPRLKIGDVKLNWRDGLARGQAARHTFRAKDIH